MSRSQFMLLAALSATSVVPAQVQAQGTMDTVTADSASVAPTRSHGGLFGRVKKVAGNKVVQGVAKGVACNAVPGAAAAAAAAGSDACPAGGMTGGGSVNGAIGGAVGGALGASASAQGAGVSLPDGTMPSLGALMPGAAAMGGMGSPGSDMKLNEAAAAKCLGLTVEEVRDVMNQAPDAAAAERAAKVRDKLVKRAQQNTQPADLKACGHMWELQ